MSTQNPSANKDNRFMYPIMSKIRTPEDFLPKLPTKIPATLAGLEP